MVVTCLYIQTCVPRSDRRHLPSDVVPPSHFQYSMLDTPGARTEGTRVAVTAEAGEIAFRGVTMSLHKLPPGRVMTI